MARSRPSPSSIASRRSRTPATSTRALPAHRRQQRGGLREHLGGPPRAQRERERRQLRRARRRRVRRHAPRAGPRATRSLVGRRRGDERGALPRVPEARRGSRRRRAFLGEGAALFALETRRERAQRAAPSVLAEVDGYGTAFVPPEREASLVHPSPEALERAIADALADAGTRRARRRPRRVRGVGRARVRRGGARGDRARARRDVRASSRRSAPSARRSAPAARWAWLAALACVRRAPRRAYVGARRRFAPQPRTVARHRAGLLRQCLGARHARAFALEGARLAGPRAHGRSGEMEQSRVSWIDEKAHAELARVRKAREKQVYPYFREFETRRPAHARSAASRHQLQLERLPRPHQPPEGEGGRQARGRQVRVRPVQSRASQATTTEHVELEQRLAQVVRLREVPHLHDRLPGDARHASSRSPTRTRRSSSTPTATPASSTARFLAAGVPRNGARGPLLQPQLGQEPRAHPEDARAQERARRRRGRLLARRRHGEPAGVRRDLRPLRRGARRRRRARQRDAWASTAAARSKRMGSRAACPSSCRRSRKIFGGIGGAAPRHGRGRRARASTRARSFLFSASLPVPIVAAAHDHPRHARDRRRRARRASCTRRRATSAAS